jgi:hypothetical protein
VDRLDLCGEGSEESGEEMRMKIYGTERRGERVVVRRSFPLLTMAAIAVQVLNTPSVASTRNSGAGRLAI